MTNKTDKYVYSDVVHYLGHEIRARRVFIAAMSITAINSIIWCFWGIVADEPKIIFIQGWVAVIACLIIGLRNRIKYRFIAHAGINLVILNTIFTVIGFDGTRPSDSTTDHLWFIVIAITNWFVLRRSDPAASNVYVGLCVVLFFAFEFSLIPLAPIWPQPAEEAAIAQAITRVSVLLCVLTVTFIYMREISSAETHLETANEKLEEILTIMLPKSVSERLRAEGKAFADGYANTSVLFADLVGFTTLSAKMDPLELVKLLNQLFSKFDQYTDELGLEKIKTIGDAYMAAGGLPDAKEDHAEATIELALRIRAELTHYADLSVRIGINSGEVVAGVIGKKRFIYDLWGDTVNIASRMESHGLKDEIQISEQTYNQVKHKFVCESRGEIDVKGRGVMTVYLVKGRKSGSSPAVGSGMS